MGGKGARGELHGGCVEEDGDLGDGGVIPDGFQKGRWVVMA